MNIVKPQYEILTEIDGVKELEHLERVARLCYKSEDKIVPNVSAEKLILSLIKRGHEAMIEHGGDISVKFTVDRITSQSIVRHRLASFAQESTRYCSYDKEKFGGEITVIHPLSGFKLDKNFIKLPLENQELIIQEWEKATLQAEESYMKMIELGATAQLARVVLNNSLKTEIIVKQNYRSWRNFFKLRTPSSAHPHIRELAIPLLEELKEKLPALFDDITYD